jgi:DNA-binding XRE family transcriptional regulator
MESNRSRTIRKNRVRELRENRLMTQAQLARKAKVALRTIHSVEKGMNCRMDTKRKILLALGLRFEDKDHVFPPKSAMLGDMSDMGSEGSNDPSSTPPSTPSTPFSF